jgi:Putative adhesin
MLRHRNLGLPVAALTAMFFLIGCNVGPSANGSFDRTFTVSGPIRLEVTNTAGNVDITGSADGKVHIHADVRASGMGFDKPQKRLSDTLANPPVEQRGDTIRIGKDGSHMRNLAITYNIQVPHDTEVSANVVSGAQTIRGIRGPVKVQAVSGVITVEKIDRDIQLNSTSGSVSATDIGDDVKISSVSGNVNVSNVKGDVIANAVAGVIRVSKPGGRVDADAGSGEVEIQGAMNNVKAHAASGLVSVQGNPDADSYWELKTISGGVQLNVPATSNFHLSAEAVSGEIRADIPIVIEEQGKRSLRAHMGSGGGRVEVHTVSGDIRVSGSNDARVAGAP